MERLKFYVDEPSVLKALFWLSIGKWDKFKMSRFVSRRLRETMEGAGLIQKEKNDAGEIEITYPLVEAEADANNFYLRLHMLPGQTSKQWEGKQDAFAHALGCDLVAFKVGRGIVDLTLQHTEMKSDSVLYKEDREARFMNVGYAPGRILTWDFDKSPHMLVVGITGSGKSTFIRNLLVQIGKTWTLKIVDGKTVEFSFLKRMGYDVTTSKEDLLRVMAEAEEEMDRRYRLMDEKGVNEYWQAGLMPYFVLVDEFITLVESMQTKVKRGKPGEQGEDKSEKEKLFEYLYKLSTKGRAAGVQLILILQRPDSTFMPTAVRDNLTAKVVLRGSEAALEMAFGSEFKRLSQLPRGQGYCFIEDQPITFAFANYELGAFKVDMDRGEASRDREEDISGVVVPFDRKDQAM